MQYRNIGSFFIIYCKNFLNQCTKSRKIVKIKKKNYLNLNSVLKKK